MLYYNLICTFLTFFVLDEYARVFPEDVSTTSLCKNRSVPPLGDIDIRVINRCLYPKPDKEKTK